MQHGARKEEIDLLLLQLKQANHELTLAAKNAERAKETAKKNLLSLAEKDNTETLYQVALDKVAQIKQQLAVAKLPARRDKIAAQQALIKQSIETINNAKWLLAQRNIYAKQAGVVNEVFYRVGEYVNASSPVLSILLNKQKKVRFFVPQAKLSTIHLLDKIQINTDNKQSFSAEVSYISSAAEFTPPVLYNEGSRNNLVFLIEATLENNSKLNPGQPVTVILQ
jgi:HlyD family secretion protein